MALSKLSDRELRGLTKLGEVLIPKNPPFPSFQETGCIAFVDKALEGLPSKDLADLKAFLRVVSFFPRPMVLWTLNLLKTAPLGDFRKAALGIKALAMTLYYSGKTLPGALALNPLDLIGFKIKRVPLSR